MQSETAPFPHPSGQAAFAPSRRLSVYAGWALSTLAILFLTLDAAIKILRLPPAVQGSAELGFAAGTVLPLGIVLLACVVLYAIPATSILGAILLTGYLGGAIATHV
ncbi:MAG TPA: DoxX family protein, partial [Myxococcaceae bacterium]|nr:DoxX family protein [Myxococcaceae bacterium]